MRKRVVCFILSILFVLIITGCSGSEKTPEFADKEWLFYDEVAAEDLRLCFGGDGTFSYSCECGEPVGDSDLYEKYEYNAESGIITLSNSYDDATDEIEVIDYSDYHLMVKIDGEMKDFILWEMDAGANFYTFEGESYLEGYESRCTVVDIKDDHIVYGPVNYDPEGPYADGPFEEYELAENVPIFDMSIRRYMSIQDDQEYEEFYDVSFTELSREDVEYILDSGAGAAFVWYDDELRVEKIVFYGELSVVADYVSVTVPAELTDETTQEYLDTEVEEGLYDVAHLNEDGSIFYLMERDQYETILTDMKRLYNDSIAEMCDEELYGICDIKAADDFSKFEVILSAENPPEEREWIRENLIYMGKKYAIYSWSDVIEIEVKFSKEP